MADLIVIAYDSEEKLKPRGRRFSNCRGYSLRLGTPWWLSDGTMVMSN